VEALSAGKGLLCKIGRKTKEKTDRLQRAQKSSHQFFFLSLFFFNSINCKKSIDE